MHSECTGRQSPRQSDIRRFSTPARRLALQELAEKQAVEDQIKEQEQGERIKAAWIVVLEERLASAARKKINEEEKVEVAHKDPCLERTPVLE